MTPWTKLEAFHAHLDGCPQCRANPFNLCEVGEQRLILAILAEPDAPQGDLSLPNHSEPLSPVQGEKGA